MPTPDENRVEDRVEAYVAALVAGTRADLDELAAGLAQAERAELRARALASECVMRAARGEAVARADYAARLESEEEQRVFEQALADQRAARMALPGELVAGSVLDGRYEIRRELGEGGMGRVYAAFDRELERDVACKVLRVPLDPARRVDWEARFRRESKTLARLESRNIVAIHDLRHGREHSYIVMDLVDGLDLGQIMQRLRAVGRTRDSAPLRSIVGRSNAVERADLLGARTHEHCVTAIMTAVARAVEAAHTAGVVHRDIKPQNIVLVPGGEPVLLDFGLASGADDEHVEFVGTPEYLAPEQVERASSGNDPRTDVYQLGLLLLELLTLEPAIPRATGADLGELLERVRRGPERTGAALSPKLAPGLAAILAKALARDPAARYPDARALREDLERCLAGLPPRHARVGIAAGAALRARKALLHPMTWVASALFAGGLALLREPSWVPPSWVRAFYAEGGALEWIEPGQTIDIDGPSLLGLDLTLERRTWLYAFSTFGPGTDSEQRRLRPVAPDTLEAALAEGYRSRGIGPLELEPGEHRVACALLRNPDPFEGLLVVACAREEPGLTRLQEAMLQREKLQGTPLRLEDVDTLDAELRATTRGDPLSELGDAERATILGEALAAPSGTADGLWRRRGWASWDFLFAVRSPGHR